jgi:hypothetical protein
MATQLNLLASTAGTYPLPRSLGPIQRLWDEARAAAAGIGSVYANADLPWAAAVAYIYSNLAGRYLGYVTRMGLFRSHMTFCSGQVST